MITHTLSEREKIAIDAILSQAESEYLYTSCDSINKIDDQCRSIWPDWDVKSISKARSNHGMTLKIDNENKIPKDQKIIADVEDEDIEALKMKNRIEFQKLNERKASLNLIDNENIETTSTYPNSEISTTQTKTEASPNDIDDAESEKNPDDMNILRNKVKTLMDRISNSVVTSDLSPESQMFINKVKKSKGKGQKSNGKGQKSKQVTSKINSTQSSSNKASRSEKVLQRKTDSNCYENYDDSSSETSHGSHVCKTNKEAKSIISSTTKKMKVIESENQMLKKRLADLEKSFKESQKEIESLKTALRKSEAIRAKLTSQNAAGPRKRRKLEMINPY
ncbi:hypothetical protein TRFO_24275 [Tritrichomonas foetus]|uniref:Uncharacterized protein n=1 Tax=Tritrichomonas foetus TaxID=1144522 RepID=A0A1J4K7U9_9EUKA|nr:hypothetical protein TRFO_24275 [Tritrichomonas foetus]|eukprot:OHT07463.1 hypothetical protein TRFO_24275 [Tritrichomonas foetus]